MILVTIDLLTMANNMIFKTNLKKIFCFLIWLVLLILTDPLNSQSLKME